MVSEKKSLEEELEDLTTTYLNSQDSIRSNIAIHSELKNLIVLKEDEITSKFRFDHFEHH